jgi:DNA-directed RNA polymerase specialized sigma24 family protein
MAEVLGISESNVGVRLNRIKKRLAEELKEG